jgi:hypothetical protein
MAHGERPVIRQAVDDAPELRADGFAQEAVGNDAVGAGEE